jgi:hypothetical protein
LLRERRKLLRTYLLEKLRLLFRDYGTVEVVLELYQPLLILIVLGLETLKYAVYESTAYISNTSHAYTIEIYNLSML